MKKLLNTLYVTNPDAYVCKKEENICVSLDGRDVLKVPIHLLESVVFFGHVGCSTAVLMYCAQNNVSVVLLDERARFRARVEGSVSGNVLLRQAQFRRADDIGFSLNLSKRFVAAKIKNARSVLQRQARDHPKSKCKKLEKAVDSLKTSLESAVRCETSDELRGIEGDAAHSYFNVFGTLIRSDDQNLLFSGRSRRPPKDPVNATLSFFYTMLARELATACETVGLDPQMGYYHRVRPGRMSLALDVIEELRAPYVDRFVLTLFNRQQLGSKDFARDAEGGTFFTDNAMKRALDIWQRRKQEEVVHPFLKEKIKLGLVPFVQVQLLSRLIRGDIDDYPAYLWR